MQAQRNGTQPAPCGETITPAGETIGRKMPTTKIAPRIYVACLASYNAGRLYGAWIDATQDADDIHADVAAMLAASPTPGAEEWAIHDSEGLGAIGEWESFDRVAEIGQAVAEAGDNAPALLAWLDYDGSRDVNEFADTYAGRWDSVREYAEDFADTCGDLASIPDSLACYIDFDAYGRDLVAGGDVYTVPARWQDGGGVYVFRCF